MLKIKIKNKHIKNGVRNSWYSCPIALYIKETQKKRVFVAGGKGIYIKDFLYVGATRQDVRKINEFIRSFDAGRDVKPEQLKNVKIVRVKEG